MRNNNFLRIISCILTLALLLGVFVSCKSNNSGTDDIFKINSDTNDTSNTVKVTANEITVPQNLNMTPICKNGTRVLFADMATGEFAIQDQLTEEIWYSNPPDREEDPYFGADRAKVFSLLTLHCLNTVTMVDEYLTSYSDSVLEDGVSVTTTDDGLLIKFEFVNVKITVPLKITLTNDGLKASVDIEAIQESNEYLSMDFGVLPYFGAGGVKDDGYLVVPDGSGALINFNNNKESLRKYSASIYGNDPVLIGETKGATTEYTALPLFGLKNGDNGFAAIISEGDAVASLTAGVSKSGSGYNNIFANFLLRTSGSDIIGGKEIRTYEKGNPKVKKCEISFTFLHGDNANYVGVANVYRAYLENRMQVKTPAARKLSVFLELYGAIRIKKSVMGFPTEVTMPITTFKQAESIVSELKSNGVENLIVEFQNADNASLNKKVPNSFSPISKLGGKKQYIQLKKALDKWQIPLVSNINLTTFQKSGNGFSVRSDTAQLFTGLPGLRYSFKLNTGVLDDSIPLTYYLAPTLIDDAVRKLLNKYDVSSYGYIGLDTFAKDVYSDFSAKKGSGRQNSLELLINGASIMAEKSSLYIRNGNGGLLPLTSYIYDISSDCSYFDIIDESVPIYQIAVSGLIPYSLEGINACTDSDYQLLKCVEYGADFKFNISYSNFGVLGEPSFGYLNGTNYQAWKDYIVQANKRLAQLNGKIGNGRITYHEQIADDVFVTTYDNGVKVVVNYTVTEFTYEGVSVNGRDFAVVKGGLTNE